jgi:GMP synthase (glutamine-hydrolysing)
MRKSIALIEMGTPPQAVLDRVGSQSQWFADVLGWHSNDYRIYRPEQGDALPTKHEASSAIISGSWSMVTEGLDWSERVAEWIRTAVADQLPLLGVCYGHQLMAHALGGAVDDNPNGLEQGLKPISIASLKEINDPLIHQLPLQFTAWLCHYQTVTRLPKGADVLLRSQLDDHQMIRYNPITYSVQFHPEFSKKTMAACCAAEGNNDPALLKAISSSIEPHWALTILERFSSHWNDR